ncbi:phosphate ABC transporter permease subunit PstC [Pseudahrensia aquimaris]|uniref:Phosphate transport system permease protein n=1 Tax=Pseudahrensia aquimaris TaxID=744461 RepID=A0ABW3FFN5_9HYPH
MIFLALTLVVLAAFAWLIGQKRASVVAAGAENTRLHSRPNYHGLFLAIMTAVPALVLIPFWNGVSGRIIDSSVLSVFAAQISDMTVPQIEAFLRDAYAIANGGIVSLRDETKEAAAELISLRQASSMLWLWIVGLGLAAGGFLWGYSKITAPFRARTFVERFIRGLLIVCSGVAILTTVGIIFSLIFESIRFFNMVSLFDFLFGIHWSPQSAFQSAGGAGADADNSIIFGAVPLFAGTLLITFIAMCVAAPIGLMSAIYLSDYASPTFRAVAKPALEILAGVPTVVYGFFAALTVAPAIRGWGEGIGLTVSSESALAAGLVMGIMIIPFVSSLSDDVINAVPQSLRDGSAGLGATKSETIRKVVLPAALPGIVSAMLLAVSRAVGETMIVVMAAGLAANLTINPLEAVTTVTVQIVTLLVGDQEFDSAKTLAAFALGLVLFIITLTLNIIALRVVQKYREQYD